MILAGQDFSNNIVQKMQLSKIKFTKNDKHSSSKKQMEICQWFLTLKIYFKSQILTFFDDDSVDGFKKFVNFILGQKPF